ncbi:histone H3-like centromeric protein A [Eupeodes corollae]|uniref:histone H3-like centromeric protein A n=1 Tax=Eupeodes corollae TaxID=290404 RepID=UPI0024927BB3|nr:histone H3-like centromeric protein A [Eupeodes corollae]
MPRRQSGHATGPGPKSKTKSKTKQAAIAFLGDSSASEGSEAESFQSVELEADRTDYGFNYTNSSPHHSRQVSQRRATPVAVESPAREARSSPLTRSSFIPRNTNRSSTNSRSRKQMNPVRREQMLWKQIKQLQQKTDNLTPKAPFGRLIRELLIQESTSAHKITVAALEALQTSAEIYITSLFSDSYLCTLHRGRVTLGVQDLRLVRFLRGTSDTGNK